MTSSINPSLVYEIDDFNGVDVVDEVNAGNEAYVVNYVYLTKEVDEEDELD